MTVSTLAKLGRRVLIGVVVTLVALAAGLGLASRFGWIGLLEVQGGSMQPTISNGSLLITSPRPAGEVRPGDVVSIVGTDHLRVTHRVVDVTAAGIVTRGDANRVSDGAPYTGNQVDHVRAVIPALGSGLRWVSLLLHSPYLVGLVALTFVLLIFGERLDRTGREDLAVTV